MPPARPSFRQIYRQQYRQVSSSRASRVSRMTLPFVFLVVAVLAHHRPVVSIVLGALAILLLAVVIIWGRRERRHEAANTKNGAAGSVKDRASILP